MTIIGTDTFIRADQSGWGTASDGQTWSQVQGAGTLAIASNEGTFTGQIASDEVMVLGSTNQADTDCLVRFKVTNSGNDVPGVVFRSNGSNTFYRVRNNSGSLGIRRINAGTSTTIGVDVTVTMSSGVFYWIRGKIVGSTISCTMWADGGSEPAPQLVVTDGTPISAAGRFGIYASINTTATDTIFYDHFTATDTVVAAPSTKPRYIPRGFLSTIVPDPVTQPLAYKERGIGSTIIYEIRTFIPRALNGTYIPDTWRMQPRALGSRFVQSLDQLKDITTRFRLMQQSVRDVTTRFRLASVRDIATRFRLGSLKDIASRFRLMQQSVRDVATRFRLAKLQDIAARFRLGLLKDVATRFRLMQQSVRDIATRFRLAKLNDVATRFRLAKLNDIKTRFRLMSANQLRDIASRFRLGILKDVTTRFRLAKLNDIATRFKLGTANQSIRDIASRFRLMSANQLRDVATRFRLARLRDVAARFRLGSLRDIAARFRLMSASQLRDIALRFILTSIGAPRTKDIACRFVLIAPPDVVWVTRDGKATWLTRDGIVSWATRDEKAAWGSRDDQATWDTRDDKAKWTTRR